MTNEEAIKILKNEYLCRININSDCAQIGACMTCEYAEDKDDVTNAIGMAIEALSKQSASSEQAGKDIKFPTIHCCRGYDCIKDENGRMGFGVYDPKEKNIYIAGDVPKEIFLKTLFHEIFHWMQNVAGMKFDEDDANSFSDILYDAVDMFDDHGPELFGQKTIVEPGEVFVGENVLKEKLDHQFRDSTKKTDSERVSLLEQEKSNSFSKEPPEDGIHEMNCIPTLIRCKNCAHSTEWYGQKRRCFLWHEDGIDVWEDGYCNYADRKEKDVPDTNVVNTTFKPGDKFILELGQERKMFGEFEIAGTDLYVKTDLLEKLTRYEPEENATADKILNFLKKNVMKLRSLDVKWTCSGQ